MKRIIAVLMVLCLAAATVIFAACGDKEGSGNSEATAAPGTTESANQEGGSGENGPDDKTEPAASENESAPGTTEGSGSDGSADPANPNATSAPGSTADPNAGSQPGETPDPNAETNPDTTTGTGDASGTEGSGDGGASLIEDDDNLTIVIPSDQASGGLGGNNP